MPQPVASAQTLTQPHRQGLVPMYPQRLVVQTPLLHPVFGQKLLRHEAQLGGTQLWQVVASPGVGQFANRQPVIPQAQEGGGGVGVNV